ncbi:MAG: B12-binding domain-containing radical SAM protein [Candidatus Omnitrophica bacterium]|nr:B12-binding domain-containing radical SAM protein [Candidatus Omnitrophota bacterium]
MNDNKDIKEYVSILKKMYSINDKVLLIQAPQFLFDTFNLEIARRRAYYAYPPTGLEWLAAALYGRKLNIEIFDLNYLILKRVIEDESFDVNNWPELLEDYLASNEPSIVGVSSINVKEDILKANYPLTAVLNYFKKRGKQIVLAGGPIAADEYKDYLEHDICHFVLTGEGENKINYLFDLFFDGETDREPLQGIFFKHDGLVRETEGQRDIVKLRGNLVNVHGLVPFEGYNKVGSLNPYSRMAGQDRPFAVFQLNRGCQGNCKFCGVTDFIGKGVRSFPVNDVLDEISYLVEKRGIRHFDVLDDAFLANKNYVVELLKGLIPLREKYGITWSSNNGLMAVSLNDDLMSYMRDSGCVGFRIGIESGNVKLLKKMRKPGDLDLFRRVAALLRRYPEIFTGAYYIIGIFGEETFGEMMETFRLASELKLDWSSIATFQFTSKATAATENLRMTQSKSTDFIPSKRSAQRELSDAEGAVSGADIFYLQPDMVPSVEQVKQIWFAFNLVENYINNKNLKEGGIPLKFTKWVEAVRAGYPHNPYMSLFAAIGRVLSDDSETAQKHISETRLILKESNYWCVKFAQFGLMEIAEDFSFNAEVTRNKLANLRQRFAKWTG